MSTKSETPGFFASLRSIVGSSASAVAAVAVTVEKSAKASQRIGDSAILSASAFAVETAEENAEVLSEEKLEMVNKLVDLC